MTRWTPLLFASILAAGCTAPTENPGSAEGSRVFSVEKSTSANASQLIGVWETANVSKVETLSSTSRFEFRSDHVVIASRCSMDDNSALPVTVGGRASAAISSTGISVKENVSQTERIGANGVCGVKLSAGLLPACDPKLAATERKNCFALSDGALSLHQGSGTTSFVKIAD